MSSEPESYDDVSEKSPLLDESRSEPRSRGWGLPRRALGAVLHGVTLVFSTITAPCRYVLASFFDEQGHFSAILPLKSLGRLLSGRRRKSGGHNGSRSEHESDEKSPKLRRSSRLSHLADDSTSSLSATNSTSETEKHGDSPGKNTRSRASSGYSDELAPQKKNARVRLLHNDEALRKRKTLRAQQKSQQAADPNDVATIATALKSPSSQAGTAKLTRYPRVPAPPRPLVPRRQPSYTLQYSPDTPKKTLILDLDETLIHSMAKGGRMSTGHMVEVRLGGSVSSSGVQIAAGVPILYYVHERPGCHDFLRKVSKWFNLIVFTASVQEYADPVIDWLERERKYFSGRYYRQHCTFRNGAYIKDLAQVEPDLSKVMILDNSPMSYIFHEGKFRLLFMNCE